MNDYLRTRMTWHESREESHHYNTLQNQRRMQMYLRQSKMTDIECMRLENVWEGGPSDMR